MAKHFVARAIGLIAVPLAVYTATFWVHFALLRDVSPGALSFSVPFQQTLKGGELPATLEQVYYGSQITLRQVRSEGAYLHSHAQTYPDGSKQQQVTTYHHRDDNNVFVVRKAFEPSVTYVKNGTDERDVLNVLRSGDRVRLEHAVTGRFLHSHAVQAPLSDKDHHYEVSAYGHNPTKFSDINDNWRVEIVDDAGLPVEPSKKLPIRAIHSKVRLVHGNLNCVLTSVNKALPEWGFRQGEVTCGRETLKTNGIWLVETNFHPKATDNNLAHYPRATFWQRFVELNKRMWLTNKHLSAEHPFGSRPGSWPLLTRGLGFWNGNHVPRTEQAHRREKDKKLKPVDDGSAAEERTPEEQAEELRLRQLYADKFRHSQIYLMGNPVVWWLTTAGVALFAVLAVLKRVADKLAGTGGRVAVLKAGWLDGVYRSDSAAGWLFMAWLLHYVPFFGMHRQLFLHHYLPALFFAVVLGAVQWEHLVGRRVNARLNAVLLGALVAAAVALFWLLAPLGYGLPMTKAQCLRIKWLPRWDWDCDSIAAA